MKWRNVTFKSAEQCLICKKNLEHAGVKYRRERAPLSPETLQEMMKFLADAPVYCATWRENGNYYAAKKTEDGRLVLLRNMERVPKRQIRLSAKRILCENWEVVHFNVE